ncbi:MAG: hypothetical protein LUD47_07225 [Clostridia bacterium]|nr:hypothetical protein [Clostridia bacterium]
MSAKKTKYEDPIDTPFEDDAVLAYEEAGQETEDGEVKTKTPRSFQHKVGIVGITFGFIGVVIIVAMSLFVGFIGESGKLFGDYFVDIVTDLCKGNIEYDAIVDYDFFGTLIVAGLWVTMVVRAITTIVRYAKGVRHEEKVQKCVKSMLITYFLYFGFVILLRSLFHDSAKIDGAYYIFDLNNYTVCGLAGGGIFIGICYCLGLISNFDLKRKTGDGGQIACSILALILVLASVWCLSGATVGYKSDETVAITAFAHGEAWDNMWTPYIYYAVAFIFEFLTLIISCKFVCGTLESFGEPDKRNLKLADIIAAMALTAVLCVFGCLWAVADDGYIAANSAANNADVFYTILIIGCSVMEVGYVLGIIAWDQKRRLNKEAVAEEEIVEESEYAETNPDIDFGM